MKKNKKQSIKKSQEQLSLKYDAIWQSGYNGWLVVRRLCFRDPYGLQGFVYQHIFAWVTGWRRTEFKQENKQEEKEIKMEVF